MNGETTLKDNVVSAALWGVALGWMVPMFGSMMALQTIFRPDQIDWLSRIYTHGQLLLTGSKWRAEVHPSIDPNRQYLFFQNHVNHLDHCALLRSTPHYKQGLELDKHFDYPVYGWFMRQRGTIPVSPKDPNNRERLRRRMAAEIEEGHSILVFPEGHRTRDGRVRPFKSGIFHIARDLGVPIIPTSVTGMQHVMRAGSLHIRPGHTITCYCDEPVETEGLSDEEIPALMERVREPMVRRVDAYLDAYENGRRG